MEFALEHLGLPFRRAGNRASLEDADAIILPGVGAAASAMRELEERDLVGALRETRLPVLGICLGLQLFTKRSDEGGAIVDCLGLVPGFTRRFGAEAESFPLPLPQIGWNETLLSEDPLFEGLSDREHFYYLHSYRAHVPVENVVAEADYGERFPAAVRSGRRVAVQFHPEKSGPPGLHVLSNFCRQETGR